MPPSTRTDHPTPVMQTRSATRLVATIGAAIGLCIMGDSLMYSILPLQAPHLGISLPLVGILLSANRLVRLLSNKWAGGIFERYGTKWPFFASVLVGLLSTAFYGIPAGFIVFLLARMSWGVAWSGLRQGGYAAVWTGSAATRGRLTGLLWGLVRLGSAIGVFAGGLLYDRAGYGAAITAVVAVGLLAIPTAYLVRWPASVEEPNHPPTSVEEDNAQVSWRQLAAAAFRSPVHRWLTLGSFFVYLLSGVVVSTTSVFLAARFDAGSGAFIFGPRHRRAHRHDPRSTLARRPCPRPARRLVIRLRRPSQHAGDARRAHGGGARCSLLAAACSGDPLHLRRPAYRWSVTHRGKRRGQWGRPTLRPPARIRRCVCHRLRRRLRPRTACRVHPCRLRSALARSLHNGQLRPHARPMAILAYGTVRRSPQIDR